MGTMWCLYDPTPFGWCKTDAFSMDFGLSLSKAWTCFKDLLHKVPHHGIDLWLQLQIFYDRIDLTLKRTVDYAAEGRLRKMSAEKAWATIEELAQYEDEGWNNPILSDEGSIDHKNPNIEQLLRVMESRVDTLMKDAILIVGRSENVFEISSDMMRQLTPEPSRQETFKDLEMNFILNQGEKKLKDEIRVKENRFKKIEKITRCPNTEDLEPLNDYKSSKTLTKRASSKFMPTMSKRARKGKSTRRESSSSQVPNQRVWDWVNLFQINESVYKELVRELFGLFEFKDYASKGDPKFKGVSFRLWASIGPCHCWSWDRELGCILRDGEFVVGGTSVKKIRDPRVRLAHCCITMTISGHKESTQRITTIDMFYLYCIYVEGVVCHIPYWLARYLGRARDMNVLCRGVSVTRIARSFGLLSSVMVDALSVEPRARTFTKKSLVTMGIFMELDGGTCCWPTIQGIKEDDEIKEEAEDHAGEITNRIACRKFFQENECEIFTVSGDDIRIFPDSVIFDDKQPGSS
ncbi:hypothetical protein Tco_1320265 [Tanacetum coccineum]